VVLRIRAHFKAGPPNEGVQQPDTKHKANHTFLANYESMRTVSPPPIKCERSDEKEPARRVERMSEFKHDEDVMKRACWMLDNVCCFHQLRESIVDAKGISTFASALESHRDNHGIQEAARAAMKLLMRDSRCFPLQQSK
jgi:hypothetical protein